MVAFASLSPAVRQYLIVTTNYWVFTLTDGALRMLVVLHFHSLGYTPLEIAFLFLFYEFFGIVTNLVGGWLGARIGLNHTMNIGLALQIAALSMLLVPTAMLSVAWVMAAQALSGIAKDLNKMSAKSAIKTLVPPDAAGSLYKWVAFLTGSKNALKGVGFFVGAVLLALIGFWNTVASLVGALFIVWLFSVFALKRDLGKAKNKPTFSQLFAKSRAINLISAARLFLFCARDVWFVVAVPVYLSRELSWEFGRIGAFMALWVIGYGVVQALTPRFSLQAKRIPDGKQVVSWGLVLAIVPAAIAIGLMGGSNPTLSLILGLLIFGVFFAMNSALHSFLIVHYANEDGVSLDVGFYYMANAAGRLLGTLLSGWVFQVWGLVACLWISAACVLIAVAISLALPRHSRRAAQIERQ